MNDDRATPDHLPKASELMRLADAVTLLEDRYISRADACRWFCDELEGYGAHLELFEVRAGEMVSRIAPGGERAGLLALLAKDGPDVGESRRLYLLDSGFRDHFHLLPLPNGWDINSLQERAVSSLRVDTPTWRQAEALVDDLVAARRPSKAPVSSDRLSAYRLDGHRAYELLSLFDAVVELTTRGLNQPEAWKCLRDELQSAGEYLPLFTLLAGDEVRQISAHREPMAPGSGIPGSSLTHFPGERDNEIYKLAFVNCADARLRQIGIVEQDFRKHFDFPAPGAPYVETDRLLAPVAASPGVSLAAVPKVFQPEGGVWPHAAGEDWTDEERAAMFKMRHLSCMSGSAIAKVVGVSRPRIDELIGPARVKLRAKRGSNITWPASWTPGADLLKECGFTLQPLQSVAVTAVSCAREAA